MGSKQTLCTPQTCFQRCIIIGPTSEHSSMAVTAQRLPKIPMHLLSRDSPQCSHVVKNFTHLFAQLLAGGAGAVGSGRAATLKSIARLPRPLAHLLVCLVRPRLQFCAGRVCHRLCLVRKILQGRAELKIRHIPSRIEDAPKGVYDTVRLFFDPLHKPLTIAENDAHVVQHDRREHDRASDLALASAASFIVAYTVCDPLQ